MTWKFDASSPIVPDRGNRLNLKGYNMKYIFLIFLFWTSHSVADSIESWNDFKTLVYQNKITNIDDLLARLPEDYTKGYSLIYRTRALHQEKVSFNRPRVLIFGKNAKFIITYNSHVTGGYAKRSDIESIETLEFNSLTGESYLREVTFTGNQVPNLSAIKVNSNKCLSCHGMPTDKYAGQNKALYARGLWDPYNSWSGIYGSLSRQGLDFMKIDSSEHIGFQQFLKEKPLNPRYSFLKLEAQKFTSLPATSFSRPFDPNKMNDALSFSDGYTRFPNQNLGMYLADYNFRRVGSILAQQETKKRAAFQYLVKGLTLDEDFVKPDLDSLTNPTDLNLKKPSCMTKIASFLPENTGKVPFTKFAEVFLQKLRADYAIRKAAVEVDNMGLSKLGAGLDQKDPFDENRGPRGLEFDSINPGTKFHLKDPANPGMTGNAALFYLAYLMEIPSQDLSTAITRGVNFQIDSNYILSGSTSLYYGNSTRCYTKDGQIKGKTNPLDPQKRCFSEPVEEFFTTYLPASFYKEKGQLLDPEIAKLSCEQLAAKSEQALMKYFKAKKK